jgi:hypothetical protein
MARSTPGFNQRSISSWMYGNAREYNCATALAEAAIDILGLPERWLQDEAHWVWDSALDNWCLAMGIDC